MKGKNGRILTPPNRNNLKSWLIERYGEFENSFLDKILDMYFNCIDKHIEYSKKRSIKYIQDNFLKWDRIYRKQEIKYWTNRGWDLETAKQKRVVRNKDWYIDTYGDKLGLDMYNTKCSNISKNCGHSLDKFKNRYGDKEGELKWDEYRANCARNLDYFVKKYGDKEGKLKYKQFKKHIGKASKESMLVFRPIISWLSNIIDVNDLYYGDDNSREFFIVKNGKTYLYDFTIKSLNIIIEFNGIKFHANKDWSTDVLESWSHPFNKLTYKESIKNDEFKIQLANDNEFDVLTIWSDTPVEVNIENCKSFIMKKINNE